MADNDVDSIMQSIASRIGGSARQAARLFTVDPFVFMINFLPLAASNTATDQFITQADSGFAISKTTFVVSDSSNVFITNISDTPKFVPLVVTLSDSGSGRDLSNLPTPVTSRFGTGERPFVWAKPKILDPNSTFTARIQNLVATAFNVRLAFHGFKIFGDVSAFKSR